MLSDSDNQLLTELTDDLTDNIIALQLSKGLKASGGSADLIRKEVQDTIARIIDGSGSFEFQEFGRAEGKAPPFQRIYDWLEFEKYGINWHNLTESEASRGMTADDKRTGIAWAITKKIAKKGTHTHITGKNTGVLVEALNRQRIKEFMQKLSTTKASELKTDISRLLK
jgi:hypothetical protein